jgi:3-hydroxyisobutyrate dehydrogenase-like beta-hydroxyacid dehydrogenase
MGSAIAQRLRDAGHLVIGCDTDEAARARWVAAGGALAAHPAALAAGCDVLLICVASLEAFAEVVDGALGVASAAAPGLLVVDTCTLLPEDKARALATLAARDAILLDCVLSGNRNAVLSGTLLVYASGDTTAFERARPVLEAFAGVVRHVGPFGHASRVKLVLNFLVCIHNAATAEAMAFATRLGLAADEIHALVSASAAGSAIWDIRGRMMVERDYRGSRGGYGIARKDGPMIAAVADRHGVGAPMFRLALDLHQRAVDAGYGDLDTASLYELCRRLSGQDALEPAAC